MINPLNDINTWKPGDFMVFDNSTLLKEHDPRIHRGLGVVISNDGTSKIRVMWDPKCKLTLSEYHVPGLNVNVIHKFPFKGKYVA